jgi:GxxExxY protein
VKNLPEAAPHCWAAACFGAMVPIAFVRLLTNVSIYEPIEFEGEHFDEGFHADLIVNGLVIIELKALEKVSPLHKKQLLTYLRLTEWKLGYLLNFGDALMKDGIRRIINGKLEA